MICTGCQGEFPAVSGPTHEYVLSSPACWAAYGEVLAREYSTPALMRLHKVTVDTYAVQHPGVDVPAARRSVVIHLSRLYLFLERGLSIERVNAAMPTISSQKDLRPWLEPPSMKGTVNVKSLTYASPAEHEALLLDWARSVWMAWVAHHPTVRQWCAGL